MEIADAGMTRMVEDVMKGNAYAQDARLLVKFYMGAVEDPEESAKAGRPMFKDVEFVRIIVPGQTDIVDRPAFWLDYERFPKHLAAFRAGITAAETGTPLTAWPVMKANQVAQLAIYNIRTVEQLASLSDVDALKFMGSASLRQNARDFMEAAKGSAPLTAMRAELDQRDVKIAELQQQMAEVLAHANKAAKQEKKSA